MFLLNHKLKKNSADKERGRNPLSMARQLQRLSKNCVTWSAFVYVCVTFLWSRNTEVKKN